MSDSGPGGRDADPPDTLADSAPEPVPQPISQVQADQEPSRPVRLPNIVSAQCSGGSGGSGSSGGSETLELKIEKIEKIERLAVRRAAIAVVAADFGKELPAIQAGPGTSGSGRARAPRAPTSNAADLPQTSAPNERPQKRPEPQKRPQKSGSFRSLAKAPPISATDIHTSNLNANAVILQGPSKLPPTVAPLKLPARIARHEGEDISPQKLLLEASPLSLRKTGSDEPLKSLKKPKECEKRSLEPLDPLVEPMDTVRELMRIASTFKEPEIDSVDFTAPRKKRSWKRGRLGGLRGLISDGPSISGFSETVESFGSLGCAVEWMLPPVLAPSLSRKAGIFNSPADIGARLKTRNGQGRSRQSAASIPIDTGTSLPALC